MKIIKLLLIFVLLTGGILLALNWSSIVNFGGSGVFPSADLIDIGDKCDEIRAAWKSAGGWDEDLYQKQRADIDQSKGMGMFSKNGYNTVNNCLRETATVTACNAYLDALHADPFDARQLATCFRGVQSVKRHENLTDDTRIKNVEERQSLYDKINAFILKKHIFTPRFDEDRFAWVSFDDQKAGELATAKSHRTHALYAEMSHVPDFRNGLNEGLLSDTMEKQRQSYYSALSQQIIRSFEEKEATPDNINSLQQVRNRFHKEDPNSHSDTVVIKFYMNYKDRPKDKDME